MWQHTRQVTIRQHVIEPTSHSIHCWERLLSLIEWKTWGGEVSLNRWEEGAKQRIFYSDQLRVFCFLSILHSVLKFKFNFQVSHHPSAAAHHAEGRGWTMYQDFTMTSRFRGKYLSVIPIGFTHVVFPSTNSHFSYRKITTTVHNIIVGKLWIDNHGEMEITNHTTNEKCVLKFVPYSYFSREQPRKVCSPSFSFP